MEREAIAELFAAYGPVSAKRMFSGFGLYAEEVCFCLVLRGGEFYLKADEQTFARFEAENCTPFSYPKGSTGKAVTINSFWRMPERLYDDPDELAEWTRAAVAAAHRAQLTKRRRVSGSKKAVAKKAVAKKAGAKTKTPPDNVGSTEGRPARRAKKT